MMQEMVQKGLKVYTPDLAEWRAAAQKVYEETPTFKENRTAIYKLIGKT
jgi:TRAP-type C4-dicarboxylate transport system substrate-binding protein